MSMFFDPFALTHQDMNDLGITNVATSTPEAYVNDDDDDDDGDDDDTVIVGAASESNNGDNRSDFDDEDYKVVAYGFNKKGYDCIFIDNFMFNFQKENKNSAYYRCSERKICNASVSVIGDRAYVNRDHAMHDPLLDIEIDVLDTKQRIRERVINDRCVTVPAIYENEVEELVKLGYSHDLIAKYMPKFNSMKKKLYSLRNESLPPAPKTVEDIRLIGEFTMTTDGQNFVLFDSKD